MWTLQAEKPANQLESNTPNIPIDRLSDLMSGEGKFRFKHGDDEMKLCGIPEDFAVYMNGRLVCEIVFDVAYSITEDKSLIEKLNAGFQ